MKIQNHRNQYRTGGVVGELNQTITSLEVAEMVERKHSHVIRDIKTILEHLAESKNGLSEYFSETTYVDSTGRTLPCFLLTKKGCELYSTRMTGAKGTQFAVAYIEAFNQMEQRLLLPPVQPVPTAPPNLIHADNLLRCLRDYGDVLNAESNRAIQSHAVELLTGKSLPKPEPLPKPKEWMTAKEIADVAKVPVQRIVWIARTKGINDDPSACIQSDPMQYNSRGKSQILAALVAQTILNK